MAEIDANTCSYMAVELIYNQGIDSWDENLIKNTEYAFELDKRNTVREGVIYHLGMPDADNKSIIKELSLRYKNMGYEEGTPKSVKNWINGEKINIAYRENLYNLCLALDLDLEQTETFFFKNYMTIPFNYKDRIDAIYYYGLKHHFDYRTIKGLLDEFENNDLINNTDSDETAGIGSTISDIDDLDKFREYLRFHTYSKKAQYNTAANKIDELIKKDAELAVKEKFLNVETQNSSSNHKIKRDKEDEINISGLLKIIYGYDYQEKSPVDKMDVLKSDELPKTFLKNFPRDEELSRIKNREASPDVYRKAIIILEYYNFYCSEYINFRKKMDLVEYVNLKEDERKNLYDFFWDVSDSLAECGFVRMYERNPFDWLILYCANSREPLETLRRLLRGNFTEDQDEE